MALLCVVMGVSHLSGQEGRRLSGKLVGIFFFSIFSNF
jgi:hypothetical protein